MSEEQQKKYCEMEPAGRELYVEDVQRRETEAKAEASDEPGPSSAPAAHEVAAEHEAAAASAPAAASRKRHLSGGGF